jgi:DNA-binding YbaB/EbfC family protein
MFNQMKQLYDMQKKAKNLQKQLEAIHAEKSNSSGTLTAVVNGGHSIVSLKIDPSWLAADKQEALQTLLVDVINDAFEEVQKKTATQTASLMKELQGFKIPGM